MKFITQIDGGGLRGVIPAVVCDYIEDKGRDLSKSDLLSGTSVGSIICAMLAAGVKARVIRIILEHEGASLFVEKGFFERLRDPNKAKYSRKYLYERIEKELKYKGVTYMSDLKTRLAVTAFGLYAKKTHYICSWDPFYAKLKVVDAVMYSALSAANYFGKIVCPSFPWTQKFQRAVPTIITGEVFQDGGQGTHNSTCVDAIITGMFGLGWTKSDSDIRLLSLGCGSQYLMSDKFADVADNGWAMQLIDYMSEARQEATCDQVETSEFIMRKFTGDSNHFCRIDPIISKELDVLDGKKFINNYVDIGEGIKKQVPPWVFQS